jgi:hypothetical protein
MFPLGTLYANDNQNKDISFSKADELIKKTRETPKRNYRSF